MPRLAGIVVVVVVLRSWWHTGAAEHCLAKTKVLLSQLGSSDFLRGFMAVVVVGRDRKGTSLKIGTPHRRISTPLFPLRVRAKKAHV